MANGHRHVFVFVIPFLALVYLSAAGWLASQPASPPSVMVCCAMPLLIA